MVNGLHLYSAFLTSGHSKHFAMLPNIHPFIHTFTHRRRSRPCKATASSPGAVRVRRLAQGHLAHSVRDWTSSLSVSSQPAPPPEPHAAPQYHRPRPEQPEQSRYRLQLTALQRAHGHDHSPEGYGLQDGSDQVALVGGWCETHEGSTGCGVIEWSL